MLTLFSRRKGVSDDRDVAKLFFDSFSRRVDGTEQNLRGLSSEIGKLRLSVDRAQISDLVLLDRLQKAEKILHESLEWIKQVAETVSFSSTDQVGMGTTSVEERAVLSDEGYRALESTSVPVKKLVSVSGNVGTLQSITTPTELQVLSLLANEGPKSAPEIGKVVSRSREHTARMMKKMFEEGYVRRDQTRIPFRYSLVERVQEAFKKPEVKVEAKEAISVPQT